MDHASQILTAAQMREAEEALIAKGESVQSLMERAGTGAVEWVWRMAAGRSVTVLCGPGNNGGDGYVIARVLHQRCVKVQVVAPIDPRTEAAKLARDAYTGPQALDASGDVLVDCLFGTGLSRPLSDDLAALLSRLARQHERLIAVDLPSGVDSDSGELFNTDLPQYDLTVALGAWKAAHWLMPAMEGMGERKLVEIGIGKVGEAARLSTLPTLLPPERAAHKYSRGMLVVVAGAMPGAALLAASAAQHGGAGYVKLFAAEDDDAFAAPSDLVAEQGSLFDLVRDERIDAFLIGPGLGRSAEARSRLDWVLACDLPTVVDADALVLLDPTMLEGRSCPIIATPHAGELDQLADAFEAVGLDRLEQVQEMAEDIEGVIVAKGPDTLIASAGSPVIVMPPAPSWLSTAGTGDVLAGLIGSRLTTGVSARRAAEQGCWLHGQAARLSGPAFSAGTLIDAIPAAYETLL